MTPARLAALLAFTAAAPAAAAAPGPAAPSPLLAQAVPTPLDVRASVAPLVDRVKGSVVTIQSVKVVRRAVREDPWTQFLRESFGMRAPTRRETQQGLGSGFLVDPKGTILTNNHVIAGADDVRVVLMDGRSLDAFVAGADPETDVAVVKIKNPPPDLRPVQLGDSERVRVGDYVLAIGNPLGLGQTVTMGIVSAKNRPLGGSILDYEDFIQTDAAINQGNSGGPLFNFNGEVVGVNSAILNPAVAMNVGFAIPINLAMQVTRQLQQTGMVRRGLLGVRTDDLKPEQARAFGLAAGAVVTAVEPRLPADLAGLRPNDVILEIAGRRVDSGARLRQIVASRQPGDTVGIVYQRGGRRFETKATLADNPTLSTSGTKVLGIWVKALGQRERDEIGLKPEYQAFVVTNVDPRGIAGGTLRPGDVIIAVDKGRPVTLQELQAIEQRVRRGRAGRLTILRDGVPFAVELG
jgi:Do/DeqQ family serine protease